jgi:hypothetical protein
METTMPDYGHELSFTPLNQRPQDVVALARPTGTPTWLRRPKQRYDPDHVFDGNLPIEPAADGRAAA